MERIIARLEVTGSKVGIPEIPNEGFCIFSYDYIRIVYHQSRRTALYRQAEAELLKSSHKVDSPVAFMGL